jgi:actin-related protein
MFPGYVQRLEKELMALNNGVKPTIIAPEDRGYSVWQGAAKLARDRLNDDTLWSKKFDMFG